LHKIKNKKQANINNIRHHEKHWKKNVALKCMAVLKQDSSDNVCYLTLCKFSMKLKKMACLCYHCGYKRMVQCCRRRSLSDYLFMMSCFWNAGTGVQRKQKDFLYSMYIHSTD